MLRGRGDESPGQGCSDIVLVVREALHPRFERRGNDLFTCLSVPLVQALTADSILVPTLHGDHVPVRLRCIAHCQPTALIALERSRPNGIYDLCLFKCSGGKPKTSFVLRACIEFSPPRCLQSCQ